jgi:hypothetical protein
MTAASVLGHKDIATSRRLGADHYRRGEVYIGVPLSFTLAP